MRPTIILLLLAAMSCSRQQDSTSEVSDTTEVAVEENYEPVFSLAKAEAANYPSDVSQILTFETKGAIPIYPDTAWMNKEEKSMDEESWATIIDDYGYYQSIAMDTLEKIGIKIYPEDTLYKRYYLFKLSGNRDFVVDMKKMEGEWGMILFNGRDVPNFCAPINVPDVMDSLLNQ